MYTNCISRRYKLRWCHKNVIYTFLLYFFFFIVSFLSKLVGFIILKTNIFINYLLFNIGYRENMHTLCVNN